MNILVAFDGSLHSAAALKYGIGKIQELGGRLRVIHVFNSGLFVGYDAIPGAQEQARRESARYIEEAKKIVSEAGLEGADITMIEGVPEEEIVASSGATDLIVVPPRYRSVLKNSACPVAVVPGYVVAPVETFEGFQSVSSRIQQEAQAAGSQVLLLGIVPIHLYSSSEKAELGRIKDEISASLRKAGALLRAGGIATEEQVREGYPDEEIARAASKLPVVAILVPDITEKSSELGKAGSMLSDDERFTNPVVLLRPEAAQG